MATGNILAEGNTDKVKVISVTFNPASVTGGATGTQSITVNGVLPGDFVYAIKPTDTPGFVVGGMRVTVANTVQMSFSNPTGVAADPGSETWLFLVVRPDATLTAF